VPSGASSFTAAVPRASTSTGGEQLAMNSRKSAAVAGNTNLFGS
jgi:hypothetical protein